MALHDSSLKSFKKLTGITFTEYLVIFGSITLPGMACTRITQRINKFRKASQFPAEHLMTLNVMQTRVKKSQFHDLMTIFKWSK